MESRHEETCSHEHKELDRLKKHLVSAPELRMSRIACVFGSAIPVDELAYWSGEGAYCIEPNESLCRAVSQVPRRQMHNLFKPSPSMPASVAIPGYFATCKSCWHVTTGRRTILQVQDVHTRTLAVYRYVVHTVLLILTRFLQVTAHRLNKSHSKKGGIVGLI